MSKKPTERRRIITGLGAAATAAALGVRPARAQSGPAAFTPKMHAQDEWMSGMRGVHRIVLDVTSPDGIPDALRFSGNLFTGHRTGYDVQDADVAIIICLRHGATAYGYNDTIWSKYGRTITPDAATPPAGNPYNTGERMAFSDLAKRGVQFMVCGTASRALAGRIAGQAGDADATMKEMAGNLIPSARIIAAGVVGVAHAQERGFSLLYVG